MQRLHSSLIAPQGNWWLPASGEENTWIKVSFVWCMFMFAAMPLWHWKGGQNPSGIRGRTTPLDYAQRTRRFIAENRMTDTGKPDGKPLSDNTLPMVRPQPGADVYLEASQYKWSPVLYLKKGQEYTLHLSSLDVNHGFSLYPMNINLQVVPGYDYGLKIVPNQAGECIIICNEYCGLGHHGMTGKIVVEE